MKAKYLFITMACAFGAMVMTSCGGTKSTQGSNKYEEEKISTPFGDRISDNNTFRAEGMAISPDMAMAKKLAIANGQQQIAGEIERFVKDVVTQYGQQYATGGADNATLEGIAETMSTNASKQFLRGARVAGNEFRRITSNGNYRCYVLLEMPTTGLDEVVKSAMDKVSEEDKKRINYNKDKFQEFYNETMMEYDFEKSR